MADEKVTKIIEFNITYKGELQKLNADLDEFKKIKQGVNESSIEERKVVEEAAQRVKEYEQAIKKVSDAAKIEEGSIAALRAENKKLTQERNNTSIATEEGRKKVAALNGQLDENNKKIKENVDGLTKQKINVGNYTASIKEAVLGNTALGKGLATISQVSGTTKTALGGVKGAADLLAKTPLLLVITLIIGALGSLYEYLKQTEEGEKTLTQVSETLQAVFDIWMNKVLAYGQAIYRLITGDFKGALESLKDLGNQFMNLGEDMKGAFKTGKEIAEAEDALIKYREKAESEIRKIELSYEQLIQKANELRAAGKTKEFQEASGDALRLIDQRFNLERSLVDKELELYNLRDKTKNADDRNERAERADFQKRLDDIETSRAQAKTPLLLKEAKALNKGIKEENKDAAAEAQAALQAQQDAERAIQEKAAKALSDYKNSLYAQDEAARREQILREQKDIEGLRQLLIEQKEIEVDPKATAAQKEAAQSLIKQGEESLVLAIKRAEIEKGIQKELSEAELNRLLEGRFAEESEADRRLVLEASTNEKRLAMIAKFSDLASAYRKRGMEEEATGADHTAKVLEQSGDKTEEQVQKESDSTLKANAAKVASYINMGRQISGIAGEFLKDNAEATKAMNIFEATLNMAASIASTLAQYGATPVGIALSAVAGALGAAQIALIAAQPIPQLASGGITGKRIGSNDGVKIAPLRSGDDTLAYVRTGEVVLNQSQQQALGGANTFRSIGVPGFATGGLVLPQVPSFQSISSQTSAIDRISRNSSISQLIVNQSQSERIVIPIEDVERKTSERDTRLANARFIS